MNPLAAALPEVAARLLGQREPANTRHTTECVRTGDPRICDGRCALEDM